MRRQALAQHLGIGEIGLVPHEEHRNLAGVDLAQHGVDRGDATVGVGRARVDHVQQEIRVDDLLERRPERVDELVRQAPYEADGVGEQNGLAAGKPEPASSGSSVENNWFSTSTPAWVSWLSSVDLPALV